MRTCSSHRVAKVDTTNLQGMESVVGTMGFGSLRPKSQTSPQGLTAAAAIGAASFFHPCSAGAVGAFLTGN